MATTALTTGSFAKWLLPLIVLIVSLNVRFLAESDASISVPSNHTQAVNAETVVHRSFNVQLDDKSFAVSCSGTGSPVVVLLGGYGGGIRDWATVQPELGRSTRVCSYDRAGVNHEASHGLPPLTAQATSRDLHELLAELDVGGPVVLVGFSVGGLFARYHASTYPDEVAGVVLIDPTPPTWPAMRLAGATVTTRNLLLESLSGLNPNEPELLDMLKVGNEVYGAAPIEAPVLMVTSGIKTLNPGFYGDELNRVLRKLQQTEARDLKVTEEVAEGCTHNIPGECPDEVTQLVLQMLNTLTARR